MLQVSGWSLADFTFGFSESFGAGSGFAGGDPSAPPHSAGPTVAGVSCRQRPASLMRKKLSVESTCAGVSQ